MNDKVIEAMQNLVGLIDTPIGRRKQSPEIITNVKVLRKYLEAIAAKK